MARHDGPLPPKHEKRDLSIDVERYSIIDGQALQLVSGFITDQKDLMKKRHENPVAENMDFFNHVMRLAGAKALVTKDVYSRADASLSFVDIARSEGKIVGFSIFLIKRNEANQLVVVDNFFGVGWDQLRKGIAAYLVDVGHQHLRELGIREYITSVWTGSKGVVEKVVNQPLVPKGDPEGKHFIVQLSAD